MTSHAKTRSLTVALALPMTSLPAGAQWKNLPMDGVPMKDGKPDMSAPAPRTASGQIDLSGIYMPPYRHFANLAADIGIANVPMTDEARKIHR